MSTSYCRHNGSPRAATHWSARKLADELGVSHMMIAPVTPGCPFEISGNQFGMGSVGKGRDCGQLFFYDNPRLIIITECGVGQRYNRRPKT